MVETRLSKKRKNMNMAGADHLSELPEHLIQHIMSYLRSPGPIRLSAVSKRLSSAYNSYPSLHLDSFHWRFREDAFFPAALLLLRRRVSLAASAPLSSLSLNFYHYRNSGYSFPPVLLSATTLLLEISAFAVSHGVSCLHLCCRVNSNADGGIRLTPVPFPSDVFSSRNLRSIFLCGLNFASPEVVVDCPLLECFHLAFSSGITCLEFGHDSARNVGRIAVHGCEGLERVCVRGAGKLREFLFSGSSDTDRPCRIDFDEDSCRGVELLDVSMWGVGDEWFAEVVPELASLESLVVKYCNVVRNLRVCNANLKRFELAGCSSIQCLDVAVPGLESFVVNSIYWRGKTQQMINISECTSLRTVKLARNDVRPKWIRTYLLPLFHLEELKLDGCVLKSKSRKSLRLLANNLRIAEIGFLIFDDSSPLEFQKRFLHFLYLFGHCNTLLLSVHEYKEHYFMVHSELRNTFDPPLCDVKHLKIQVGVGTSEAKIMQLVDGFLFLAPNLETLIFFDRRDYSWKPLFSVKFHSGLQAEGSELICCSNGQSKCWRHGLTEIVIEKADDRDIKRLRDYFINNAKTARISYLEKPHQDIQT